MWLSMPGFPEEMRPDRFGVVMDVHADAELPLPLLILWQFIPGRLQSENGRSFVSKMTASENYIVMCLYGPSDIEFFFPSAVSEAERESNVTRICALFTGNTVKVA